MVTMVCVCVYVCVCVPPDFPWDFAFWSCYFNSSGVLGSSHTLSALFVLLFTKRLWKKKSGAHQCSLLVANVGEKKSQCKTCNMTLRAQIEGPLCRLQIAINWRPPTNVKKQKLPSLEPLLGLSTLGCCRFNIVQHGGLRRRGPAPTVDIKAYFKVFQVNLQYQKHKYGYYLSPKCYTLELNATWQHEWSDSWLVFGGCGDLKSIQL